ncbi:MAG TPA: response regulator [Longimicrobiales bacterium]|nr:response regulator [Longimicrobiales bacterium]
MEANPLLEFSAFIVVVLLAAAGFYWFRRRAAAPVADGDVPAAVGAFVPQRTPRAEAVDLSEILSQIREPLERALPGNIRLRVDPRRRLPAARADRGQVELIIAHLASAARDAMPDGGTLTIRTYASPEPGAGAGTALDSVVLEFEHTDGIEPALLPRLFEPLFTGLRPGGTLRLGLATVQALVYHNHGRMRIESLDDGGTRIGVVLPRFRQVLNEARSPGARGRETILVVEDEDAIREIVRRTLEKAGYTILEAGDPLTALDILDRRKEDIDLLLSDIFMHHMRGTELVRQVREQWPLVRVLYMSGYGHDPAIVEEVARDGALLVSKPFTADELLGAVRRALDALPGPQSATAREAVS